MRETAAVVCGSAVGGQGAIEIGFEDLYVQGRGRVHPLTIPKTMSNAGASHISMEFRLTGPTYTVSTACSSANHAMGQAFRLVRDGYSDVAVTGGGDAPLTLGMLKAWEAMRVISPDTCRPFSKDRRGMILGEGGAMMVLEPWEAAKARGAKIYAEICGFGMTSRRAPLLTQPTIAGPARAMRAALVEAGLAPEAVGYINAHGTGTPGNDPTETSAIREVFGAHADKLAVSSTKSMHGHALGAAGALEAIATVLALYHGILPPTANYNERDPECDLDYIPNQPRAAKVEAALSELLRLRRLERRGSLPRRSLVSEFNIQSEDAAEAGAAVTVCCRFGDGHRGSAATMTPAEIQRFDKSLLQVPGRRVRGSRAGSPRVSGNARGQVGPGVDALLPDPQFLAAMNQPRDARGQFEELKQLLGRAYYARPDSPATDSSLAWAILARHAELKAFIAERNPARTLRAIEALEARYSKQLCAPVFDDEIREEIEILPRNALGRFRSLGGGQAFP